VSGAMTGRLPQPDDEPDAGEQGGDPACWLDRVCDACGRLVESGDVCPACGARLDR
jgi:uncharacterized protein